MGLTIGISTGAHNRNLSTQLGVHCTISPTIFFAKYTTILNSKFITYYWIYWILNPVSRIVLPRYNVLKY